MPVETLFQHGEQLNVLDTQIEALLSTLSGEEGSLIPLFSKSTSLFIADPLIAPIKEDPVIEALGPAIGRRVSITSIAHLLDGSCRRILTSHIPLRRGHFFYLNAQGSHIPFDDYTVSGLNLLIGALCNIKSIDGTFATEIIKEPCTPDILYHVLKAPTESDTRYLRHVLALTPASSFLSGNSAAETLDVWDLMQVSVPLPPLEQRLSFTRFMDLIEQEIKNTSLESSLLLTLGDVLFARKIGKEHKVALSSLTSLVPGALVPFKNEFEPGAIPVISARGIIGTAEEALVNEASIVCGDLSFWMAAHWQAGTAAPNANTVYFSRSSTSAPLESVYFALRAAGALKTPHEIQGTLAQKGLSIKELSNLQIPWSNPENIESFSKEAQPILSACHLLEQRLWGLRFLRQYFANLLLNNEELPRISPGAYNIAGPEILHDPVIKTMPINPKEQNPELPPELSSVPDEVWDIAYGILDAALEAGMPEENLSLNFPPPNQGHWSDAPIDPQDPRWVFGTPPAKKANYAWIQQAISQMKDPGVLVMLVCNDALHTEAVAEHPLRKALAESGLLRAVISLPGRIFTDGRPPASLMVFMNPSSPKDSLLFIDAQNLGLEISLTELPQGNSPIEILGAAQNRESDCGTRIIPPDIVERIISTYQAFANDPGSLVEQPGFAATVMPGKLSEKANLLTPWTYVHRSQDSVKDAFLEMPLSQKLMTLRSSRQKAQLELQAFMQQHEADTI